MAPRRGEVMSEENDSTVDPRYGRHLTPEEVGPSFTAPSYFANKFVIQPLDVITRIAFGEQAPNMDVAHYRFAVTLSNQDAVALYRVLKDSMRGYEEAAAALAGQAKAEEDG